MNRTYRGVITNFSRSYIERDLKTRSKKQEKILRSISPKARALPVRGHA
jgi:hypothetical protein